MKKEELYRTNYHSLGEFKQRIVSILNFIMSVHRHWAIEHPMPVNAHFMTSKNTKKIRQTCSNIVFFTFVRANLFLDNYFAAILQYRTKLNSGK